MILQDILNSNLSDSHKIEIITLLQKGGLTPDQEQQKETPEVTQEEITKAQNNKTIIPTETILIGGQEFDVAIADTPESRKKGLEPYGYLRTDEGMLFIFEEESTDYFTTENCAIDLDIIFIDDDGEVIDVKTVSAYDPEPVICDEPYMFVLEVNANSGIEEGDQLSQEGEEFDEEDRQTVSKNRMLVLDSNGDVQYKLVGGERIFSRIKTKQIIKAALKAYKTDTDIDYRRVGRLVLKELDAQDARNPEYTSLPE